MDCSQPTVVDLFSGAGGLALGFRMAGWELALAIDSNESACKTYRRNLGDHIRCGSVDEGVELPSSVAIVGGPPCQGFSSAGLRRPDDKRNSLVRVFADIIASKRPPAFVFENVEGFLTSGKGERIFDLLIPVVSAGYRVHLRKINAANYGVPQHRKRVIAIGGLGWDPKFPEPTHRAHGAPGAGLIGRGLPWTLSLREALDGLPPSCESGQAKLPDHVERKASGADMERIRALKPGQRMRDLPEELWHSTYRRRAYRRVMDGTPTERRGGAPAGMRRLTWDEPSKAITSGARSEFVHPDQDRYLTLRECARIQTFPDTFEFCGTAAEKALQIGNAVPPVLALAIGRSLLDDMREAEPVASEGALLSFVPTRSNGMSEALAVASARVREAFDIQSPRKEQLQLWD